MAFKLVCTHTFHDRPLGRHFNKGDVVLDPGIVARLKDERHKNFVKVAMTAAEVAEHFPPQPVEVVHESDE